MSDTQRSERRPYSEEFAQLSPERRKEQLKLVAAFLMRFLADLPADTLAETLAEGLTDSPTDTPTELPADTPDLDPAGVADAVDAWLAAGCVQDGGGL